LHIVEGDLAAEKLPVIVGHQVVGVVDQLGKGCRKLKLGDRVGIAWLRRTDGNCPFCASGRENLCLASQYTGYHADGGYAEYATVSEDFAYELPAGIGDVEAAPLLCAGIIGYRAIKRSNLAAGGRLGIFGFGSSAHVVIQLAVARGHAVYVVSRNARHQALARELGAAWVGEDAATMPGKVHSAIVFAPAGRVVLAALSSLERGGTVALAGIHMTPIPEIDYDKYLFYERDVHPVTANTRADGRELLAEATRVGVRARTVEYGLAEANRALLDLKEGRIEGTGVLVM
jgi:propanol-preferring alcohol dehydrogenase